jgi:hypothetical protein
MDTLGNKITMPIIPTSLYEYINDAILITACLELDILTQKSYSKYNSNSEIIRNTP